MFRLALDAGHGLNTIGKRIPLSLGAYDHQHEWQLNARICSYIQAMLEDYKDIEVLRLDDITGTLDISLVERVSKANKWNATFYLSVHHNAGVKEGTGGGIMVFAYTSTTQENRERQRILYDCLIEHTGLKGNRSVPLDSANFYVLKQSTMPALLVEHGFMDSKTDVPVIVTDAFAKKCAQAHVEFLEKSFKLSRKEKVLVVPKVQEKPTKPMEDGGTMRFDTNGGLTLVLGKNDIKKIDYVRGLEPTEGIEHAYARIGCDVIVNANFFAMDTGKPMGEVIDERKVWSSNSMSPFGYAFDGENLPVFSYRNMAAKKDFIGGYPCLLKDGVVCIDSKEAGFNATSTVQRGRTACGNSKDAFVIRVIPDKVSYPRKSVSQMAAEMKRLGCTNAVNYDGGGSSQYISPWGKFISGRPVDGFICVWLSAAMVEQVTKYTVQRGDTLSKIGAMFNVPYAKIAKDNGIKNPSLIRVGQVLIIKK